MSSLIKFDFTPYFDDSLNYWVPNNASPAALENMNSRFKKWTSTSDTNDKKTENFEPIFSGYRRQILAGEGLSESLELSRELRKNYDHMVVLGIGGSALGTRAVIEAVGHQSTDPKKVSILDNLDPIVFEKLWAELDLSKTVFTVISKSGGTLETMAQCALILERLKAAQLEPSDHFVAITDPKSGALRKWVQDGGIKHSLSVPSDVGGRFSVFTPVGILPLAFAGIDVEKFFNGAQSFFKGEGFEGSHPLDVIAHRTHELEAEGFSSHVLMPYATVLKEFSSWFVQLWGESLGKESATGQRVGSTPVSAVGATDQHSLLQLLVEGPRKISTGFISIGDWTSDSKSELNPQITSMSSSLPSDFDSLSFAHGKSFGEILMAQSLATQNVLRKRSRPSYRIHLSELREANMGALMAFYMDYTTLVGASFDINPYNQPGVEEGKVILPEYLR